MPKQQAVTTRVEDNGRMPRPALPPLVRKNVSADFELFDDLGVQVFAIMVPIRKGTTTVYHVVQGLKSWPCYTETAVDDLLNELGV